MTKSPDVHDSIKNRQYNQWAVLPVSTYVENSVEYVEKKTETSDFTADFNIIYSKPG